MALNAVQLPLKKGTVDANKNQSQGIVRKKDHHNSTFVRNYLSKHIFLLGVMLSRGSEGVVRTGARTVCSRVRRVCKESIGHCIAD